MRLIANRCGEGLEFGAASGFLFAKADRVEDGLHLFHHWLHIGRNLSNCRPICDLLVRYG